MPVMTHEAAIPFKGGHFERGWCEGHLSGQLMCLSPEGRLKLGPFHSHGRVCVLLRGNVLEDCEEIILQRVSADTVGIFFYCRCVYR